METLHLDRHQTKQAASLLRKGGIVAFPTETVYGLGASIWHEEAIQKIYLAKGRPSDNPLIAHVANLRQAAECAKELPNSFFELAKAFWPGPLSIVVQKSSKVPFAASAGLDSIAIRMPSNPIALELIGEVGSPLVAPSANRSGFPSATCPEHVRDDFDGVIDAIVWGDPCLVGIESTVISLLDPLTPVILRSGMISKEQLELALKMPVSIATKNSEKPLSPGMKYRHYSPLTPLYLFDDLQSLKQAYLSARQAKKRVALFSNVMMDYVTSHGSVEFLGELDAPSLYRALRELDQGQYEYAMIYSSKDQMIWPRLIHATAGRVNSGICEKERDESPTTSS